MPVTTGVTSLTAGSTGLTPATPRTGAVTIAGTLAAGSGGTGLTSPGSSGNVLTSDGTAWTSSAGAAGTVTSVAVSGGTTGLSTSGGPITTSGTITVEGTLVVANGGTGVETLTGVIKGNGASAFSAATAGTDYAKPDTAATWSGIQTFDDGKLKMNGATSGTIIVKAPAVASTYTITYPAATTTLIGADTTDTLTNKSIAATQLTGTIAAARLPAGSIIQVVSQTFSSPFSTSSGTAVNTGFSATITPTSSSNKVLVIAYSTLGVPATGMNGHIDLVLNSSTSLVVDWYVTFGAALYLNAAFTAVYLHSPASTSARTYGLFAYRDGVAGTIYVGARQDGGSPVQTSVTLMEVVG